MTGLLADWLLYATWVLPSVHTLPYPLVSARLANLCLGTSLLSDGSLNACGESCQLSRKTLFEITSSSPHLFDSILPDTSELPQSISNDGRLSREEPFSSVGSPVCLSGQPILIFPGEDGSGSRMLSGQNDALLAARSHLWGCGISRSLQSGQRSRKPLRPLQQLPSRLVCPSFALHPSQSTFYI
ncbi:unnamed protein product [Protopolystoma xenopodis]|uniref:Uncharacterized protein n=1 Tax=Protopolystoma xenopodis TaxID=117903 RepID=A0A448WAS8_9PLAT|nr:unnamed protein product [Protopolystoma xenopodis]